MRRVIPGLVVAAALACAFAATAAPGTSASSTISGITFDLQDLAPDDGITPYLHFDPPSSSTALAISYGATWNSEPIGSTLDAPGVLTPGVLAGLGNHAEVTATSLSASVLAASTAEVHVADALTMAYPSPEFGQLGFLLSPHTALTVTAQVSLEITTADLPCWLETPEFKACQGGDVLAAIGFFGLNQADYDHFEHRMVVIGAEGADLTFSLELPVSLSYVNDSDLEVADGFEARTWAVTPTNRFLPPTVPEPGTLALLLPGLALLGWRALGRRCLKR